MFWIDFNNLRMVALSDVREKEGINFLHLVEYYCLNLVFFLFLGFL
jgi:hypothetical protein